MLKEIGKTWPQFKALLAKKGLTIQCDEDVWDDSYYIFALDQHLVYECRLLKSETPSADQVDFETNYKDLANFAIGFRAYPFASGDFDFKGDASFDTCTAGQNKDIDYAFAEQLYVNGGSIVLEGSVVGDWIEVNVIHPTYGAIKTYIKKRFVPAAPAGSATPMMEIETPYAGKIPAGLKLRLTYHSTGGTDVKIGINYDLHKPI